MPAEDWQTVRLGDIAVALSGGTPSKQRPELWGGGFPWVSAKDLKTPVITHSELSLTEDGQKLAKLAPAGSVLILVRGMTLLKNLPVAYVGRELAFNQDIKALLPNSRVSGRFLAYALEGFKNEILELVNVAGHGTGRLDTELLMNFAIDLPSIKEQLQIEVIFSAWDETVEKLHRLLRRKRERKRGLMQVLLTGKARFPEFQHLDWNTFAFNELFERVTTKNMEGNENVLTISGAHGLINQRDYFNKSVAGRDLNRYTLIKKGDFAYNKSTSRGYPYGAIKRLNRYEQGIVSTLYICFRAKQVEVDTSFLEHYFESGALNKQIYAFAQEGARNHGLLNISTADFFNMRLELPALPEQRMIAAVLNTAELEITNLEQQLDAYKLQKRGLMQQLLTGKKRVKVDALEAAA